MNPNTIQHLRQGVRDWAQRERERIDRQEKIDLDALDHIAQISNGNGIVAQSPAAAPQPTNPTPATGSALRGPTAMVTEAMMAQPGPFTLHDIDQHISQSPEADRVSKAAMSAVLYRLRNNGVIERIQEGTGRNPDVYRRVQHQQEHHKEP